MGGRNDGHVGTKPDHESAALSDLQHRARQLLVGDSFTGRSSFSPHHSDDYVGPLGPCQSRSLGELRRCVLREPPTRRVKVGVKTIGLSSALRLKALITGVL